MTIKQRPYFPRAGRCRSIPYAPAAILPVLQQLPVLHNLILMADFTRHKNSECRINKICLSRTIKYLMKPSDEEPDFGIPAWNTKKEQGVILGRPKGPGKSKLDAFRPEIESLLANGATKKFIAQRYHTTGANLHNWIKKHSLKTVKS
jgi:hypothetical protein